MSMLKTRGSKTSVSEEVEERYSEGTHGKGRKTSVSEEVEERYSEGTHGKGSKTSILEEVEGEDTHGKYLCNLYTVIVHLHSKRIIY